MGQGQSQPTRPRTDSQACKKEQAAFDAAKGKYQTAGAQFEANYPTGSVNKNAAKDLTALLQLYGAMERAHKALKDCQVQNGMVGLEPMPKKPKT
jgi:hypothetical protein